MSGKGLRWHGLLAVSACALLAGCGWFGGSEPIGKARPGADRLVAPTGSLPPPPGHREEQGVGAVDETRSSAPQVGSVVGAKGGQRAQKEALEKEIADRDAKEREQRDAKDAAEREARKQEQSPPRRKAAPAEAAPAADTQAAPEPAPVAPKS
ncbi:hypothetical protein BH11PSE3_BH11PSE3_32420 [soil metagenome]